MTIKQVYFDQILEGTKTEEFREIKDTIEEGRDEFLLDAHFGLGGWIRNNWIYPETKEADEVRTLFFTEDDYRLGVPDMASNAILSEFYKYLKVKL